ncbi:PREDICTED: uncharacterized protein LOC109132936 [Camelina sativa]|uniref:Uncharacterized protein LOC109132936 n=1 Tax=Camelina sativa TaxID=90675 RepID=A0ABM1RPL4_CAMSA|nr:PREDICTED: uncharacterized protein LOC109132936 [Camelina sativa]
MNFNYYDQDTNEFWSSFSQSFVVPDPRDEFYPAIRSPITAMPISMAVDVPAEPWKVLEDGDNDIALWNNAAAEVDAKNNDELLQAIIAWKPMEEGKEKEKEKGKERRRKMLL